MRELRERTAEYKNNNKGIEVLSSSLFIGDLCYTFCKNIICVNKNMWGETYNMGNYHVLV